jgi:hypothetical protein
MRGRQDCKHRRQVHSYLQEELSERQRTRLETHMRECEVCRRELEETRQVVEKLRSLSPEEMGRDLAPEIISRIPQESWGRPRFNWAVPAAVAACLVLAVLGGLFFLPETGEEVPERVAKKSRAVDRALTWLADSQEANGSWDAKRWGGQTDYTIGLTGLAVLAFLSGEEDPFGGQHAGAIGKGLEFMVGTQGPDGLFGPPVSGAMYNHGISTVALLETYGLNRDKDLKKPIDAALRYTYGAQKESGGWGYRKGKPFPPNTSISIWQLQALFLARAAGWEEAGPKAGKGLAWLKGVIDEKGHVGYKEPGDFPYGSEALTAMGASCLFTAGRGRTIEYVREMGEGLEQLASREGEEIDFYRWYFLTYALRAVEEITPDRIEARLHATLADRQVRTGPQAGSWEPTDQWGTAGGRVYSTALAVLSLETGRRVPRILGWVENIR